MEYFRTLACDIINNSQIQVAGVNLDIAELEIYYHTKDHPDPYVHQHLDQLTHNCWYFHKQSRSYRGGTFKGLDMTFGDTKSHGGILIRSVVHNGNLIEGPCKTVNLILTLLGIERIEQLVPFDGPLLATNSDILKLVVRAEPTSTKTIVSGPRVGLSRKEERFGWRYLMIGYRFVDISYAIKKYKFMLNLINRNDKYRHWFDDGSRKTVSDFPRKVTKVQDLCQLYGCWFKEFSTLAYL